jgi:hypothetical protein
VDTKTGPVERGQDEGIYDTTQGLADPSLSPRRSGPLRNRLRISVECREDLFDRRMVPCLATHVLVGQVSTGTDHEYAPELPRVTLHAGLPRARAKSSQGIERHPWRKQLDAATTEACGAVGTKLRIHEERAIQLEVLTEGGRKVRSAVPDDDQLGSPGTNIIYLVSQLLDLLAAKQSTKVTDEDQHDRTFFPKLSESLRLTLPIA